MPSDRSVSLHHIHQPALQFVSIVSTELFIQLNLLINCVNWIVLEELSMASKVDRSQLFEDIFDVKDIDPEGNKFDRGKSCVKSI